MDEITITLCGDKPNVCVPYGCLAEQACMTAARECGIGPVARHLFALYLPERYVWLSPCDPLKYTEKTSYQFRLRFKLNDVSKLFRIDSAAFDYYFQQPPLMELLRSLSDCVHLAITSVCLCNPSELKVREDFLNGRIPEIARVKEKALGLAVTDMWRFKLEKNLSTQIVESDYKNFLPYEVTRQYKYLLSRFLRKAMSDSLAKLEQNQRDMAFVKEQYIQTILELKPTYGCEEFICFVDEAGRVIEVRLMMNPYDSKQPGLKMQHNSKKAPWTHICSIEELCHISMRNDCTLEISRKNGVPQYFKFGSVATMRSFASLMDGYYRLTEKWTFNLCKDLPTPSLLKLKERKCHGPVSEEFARKKLLEKAQNQPGTYLLREHFYYDAYRLDILADGGDSPKTYPIVPCQDDRSRIQMLGFDDDAPTFQNLTELLNYYTCEKLLGTCIPPSEYDKSSLLLCRLENKEYVSATAKYVSKEPLCINDQNLNRNTTKDELWHGKFTVVQSAIWQRGNNSTVCAAKSLKDPHNLSYMQEFLAMANKCVFFHSEGIANMYGFILSPPTLVMEYFSLGPLDRYLQKKGSDVQEVDLVEAATYLAKALWYLEEENLCHGNIRCHNVFVTCHEDNSFKVKLADTGFFNYDPSQIHWIPPECYKNPQQACHSLVADVWAFGTTLWEIFSYGAKPWPDISNIEAKNLYIRGRRLLQPPRCHEDVYKLMKECWLADKDSRKKPQAIMRDINQTLYEVYNSRRTHTYATLISNSQSSFDDAISISDATTLPATPQCMQRRFGSPNQVQETRPRNLNNSTVGDTSSQWSIPSLDPNPLPPEMEIGPLPEVTRFPSSPSGDSLVSIDQEWTIERHQLEFGQRLGQGFYGEVRKAWLTRWSGLEREEVAVKQLLHKSNMNAELQDLMREISIMKALQHKNIVEIKGVVEDPEMLLVMEYMPRGSLLVHLRTYKDHLTEKQLLKYAADVAEGMEYLGQKHIVHRDLAARNILVASEDAVKISDFGLAQMMGQKDYYRLKTNRDLPIRWYAPETISCWRFTHKSDVWSYGVTLWEMFSFGEEPILDSCKDDELLKTLEAGNRLSCPPSCSCYIYSYLMKRCWETKPDDRPNFSELLGEINKLALHS